MFIHVYFIYVYIKITFEVIYNLTFLTEETLKIEG